MIATYFDSHGIPVGSWMGVHVLFQIQVQVLENQMEFTIFMDDIEEADYILVLEIFEQRDLADGSGRDSFLLLF